MSRVCIINDTSEWYHWGCYGSSIGLQGLVEQALSPSALAIVPINFTYAESYLPATPEAARNVNAAVEFLKTWSTAPLLLETSDIVINGEGTIHGTSAAATRLLYITFIYSHFFGKRVHLINHSVFPPADDPTALELYRLAYQSAHHIAVRESDSLRIVRDQFGREARLAFDCLPLTLARTNLEQRGDGKDFAIVTGTSGVNEANLAILKAGAKMLSGQGLRLIWLIGAPKNSAPDEMAQAMSYAEEIGADIVTADSFEEWARLIRDAKFVFTGRFHYVIARLCLGGPFAAFGGNTPKIAALLRDQDLPQLVIGEEAETAPTIARAASTKMPPRVAALAEAASANMAK